MITLNLLSPEQKKEIRLLRFFIVTKIIIIYLLLFLIITAIVLLFAKMILQNYFNKVVANYNLNSKTGALLSQDIKQFNKKLKSIQSIQNDFVPWSDLIFKINEIVPENILLYAIEIKKTSGDLQLTGRAKTRDDLKNFEKNLNDSGLFESIKIPFTSLLEKENIDFKITSSLKR
ncbi:hypothetical protein C4569_03305 [Candidatus Parcubacteria bacterium]|nr:MAG: hypothetical protein C4569_03305 [Candidatus Parcubacteria bacterium]